MACKSDTHPHGVRPSLWGDDETVSIEVLEHYRAALESKLEGYEAILSKQKYMAGNVSNFSDVIRLVCTHTRNL